jgi:hypothetical protein
MWAGAMVALYGAVIAFLGLLFDYIDHAYPNALNYYSDPYSSVSYEMASLIVLAPLCLVLMRLIRRDIARDASRANVWVRRWALYLTLFVAGATVAVDLIVLLTTFLNGEELSVRFLLKVLVVLLVGAAGFMHFSADLWGYWAKNPRYAHAVTWAVGLLAALTIAAGFLIIGSPMQARQMRFDEQRVTDLMGMQDQIVSYYQAKQKLPARISDLNDPLSYYSLPQDPQGKAYEYVPGEGMSFSLCANFSAASSAGSNTYAYRPTYGAGDTWAHGAGHQCFERTIDPERYPPIQKPAPQL